MDGELTVEETDQIKRHLSACETCGAEYQSLLFSYNLANATTQLDYSPACWQTIQERILAPAKTSWWPKLFPSVWVPVGSLGALVLVIGSIFWFFPQQDRSDEMRQVLQTYIQQREREFQLKGVLVRDGSGARMRFIQYNPFRDPDRSGGGNPFKAE